MTTGRWSSSVDCETSSSIQAPPRLDARAWKSPRNSPSEPPSSSNTSKTRASGW